MKRCKHKMTRYDWGRDGAAIARWCLGCGARMSLGPSNDEPERVEFEIQAAVNLGDAAHDWPDADVWDMREDAVDDGFVPLMAFGNSERDPEAWSWDPSRPIAEQLAETERNDEVADAMIAAIAPDLHRIARGESTGAEVVDLDALEYEVTRSAEPDCRDEDDAPLFASPEVCACTGDALLAERCEVES